MKDHGGDERGNSCRLKDKKATSSSLVSAWQGADVDSRFLYLFSFFARLGVGGGQGDTRWDNTETQ